VVRAVPTQIAPDQITPCITSFRLFVILNTIYFSKKIIYDLRIIIIVHYDNKFI